VTGFVAAVGDCGYSVAVDRGAEDARGAPYGIVSGVVEWPPSLRNDGRRFARERQD
jgi:hypothetical protein